MDDPLFFYTVSWFPTKVHADPENVHKLCKDALFKGAKRGDKNTGGLYLPPHYDKENPRVDVYIYQQPPSA